MQTVANNDDAPDEDPMEPPVPVKTDYSQKPQAPIRLKPSIAQERPSQANWHDRPDRVAPEPPSAKRATAVKKKAPTKKKAAAGSKGGGQWTLRGVSPAARQIAIAAARDAGMPVGAWVERMLQERSQPPGERSEDRGNEQMPVLEEIRARLEALEQRRGLWQRLGEWLHRLNRRPGD